MPFQLWMASPWMSLLLMVGLKRYGLSISWLCEHLAIPIVKYKGTSDLVCLLIPRIGYIFIITESFCVFCA